jgi:hypothetical protein
MKMCSSVTNITPLPKEKLGILGIEISIGIVYTISNTVTRRNWIDMSTFHCKASKILIG